LSDPGTLRVSSSSFNEQPGFDGASENHHVSLPAQGIFAIADGIGGAGPGKQAASLACAAAVEFLQREARDREATLPFVLRSYLSLPANVLFNSVVHANRKLLTANEKRNVHEKGAASIIAGFVDRRTLALASVGSLSAWLERDGRVEELLRPRTWGRLQDPRPARGGWLHRLPLVALGVTADLEPEILEFRVQSGDRVHVGTCPSVGSNKTEEYQSDGQPPALPEEAILVWSFE
jgi:serine/threonine protein phosphatase PrpC